MTWQQIHLQWQRAYRVEMVICSVNGEKIVSMSAYRKLMLTLKAGDQIKVEGKRRGSEGYVDIKFDVMIESKE